MNRLSSTVEVALPAFELVQLFLQGKHIHDEALWRIRCEVPLQRGKLAQQVLASFEGIKQDFFRCIQKSSVLHTEYLLPSLALGVIIRMQGEQEFIVTIFDLLLVNGIRDGVTENFKVIHSCLELL